MTGGRALLAAIALAVAGCSPATTVTTTAPALGVTAGTITAPAPLQCADYTPSTPAGQIVTVTITGPACTTPALIEWIARRTRRVWISALPTGAPGVLIADVGRAASTVTIWQLGASAATDLLAGTLADDLQAAGWSPLPAPGGGPSIPVTYRTEPGQ